jgi:hypothetical protein
VISVEPHIVSEILAENAKRMKALRADFDPITGENAPGKRFLLAIPDFPIPLQFAPNEMYDIPLVKSIVKAGSIKKYLKTTSDFEGCSDAPEIDDIIRELFCLRFGHDFAFWAYYEIRIEDKETGEMVPFKLNHPQILVLNKCEELRKAGEPIDLIICKARQWGGSTFCIFYQEWIGLYCATKHSFAVCAQTKSVAGNITKMLMRAMETYDAWSLRLPVNEKLEIVKDSTSGEYVIRDSHGNQVTRSTIRIGSVENPDALRGYSGEGAHHSEVGVWKDTPEKRPADLIRSIEGGILHRPNAMKVKESTPKGAGNFFHAEYMRAKNGKSSATPLFIAWWQIPHDTLPIKDYEEFIIWLYSHKDEDFPNENWLDSGKYYWHLWELGATLEGINWYRHARKGVDDFADMASEAPSDDIEAFQFSGTKVFSLESIEELRKGCCPPKWKGELYGKDSKGADALEEIEFDCITNGRLWVWAKPDTSIAMTNRYLVAVDVGGRSKKADWSVIRVFDRFAMQKEFGGKPVLVAEQRYHTDHDLLAYDAARIAKWYNNALLVIESNTLETRDQERDTDGNMTEYILDTIADIYDNLYARKASAEQIKQGVPKRWGFHTNTSTKPQIIGNLIGCIRDQLWVERSDYCCTELALYQKNEKGQFSAPPGEGMHDDVVMCTAIALWICYCDMELPVIIKKKEHKKRTLDSNSASHF